MHNIVEVSIARKDQENMRKRKFIEYTGHLLERKLTVWRCIQIDEQ